MRITVNEGQNDCEVIINCPQITEEIERIISILHSRNKKLLGTKDKQQYMIDVSDIYYFEIVDKRNFIYTEKDVFETSLTLHEIEQNLCKTEFFRNAKSQIINIAKIRSICPDFGGRIDLTLINNEKLIVSRQYAKLLKERLGLR